MTITDDDLNVIAQIAPSRGSGIRRSANYGRGSSNPRSSSSSSTSSRSSSRSTLSPKSSMTSLSDSYQSQEPDTDRKLDDSTADDLYPEFRGRAPLRSMPRTSPRPGRRSFSETRSQGPEIDRRWEDDSTADDLYPEFRERSPLRPMPRPKMTPAEIRKHMPSIRRKIRTHVSGECLEAVKKQHEHSFEKKEW